MSKNFPQHKHTATQQAHRISIVASQYNASFVDAMMAQAKQEIHSLAPQAVVEVVRAPGSYEIPLLVKLMAEHHHPDAIIALGVILRGETAHADLIAQAISHSLLQTSLTYSLPVIHEVLLLSNEEQAHARCHDGVYNRGAEAARAALAAIEAVTKIKKQN